MKTEKQCGGKKGKQRGKGGGKGKEDEKTFRGWCIAPPPGLPPTCLKLGEYLRFCQREDRGEI